MLIALVAILEALVYLSSIPLCAAVSVSTEGGLRFGVGVSLFRGRAALRRARRGEPARGKRGKPGPRLPWRALRRLRGADIRLRGRLCLGDAAATAWACGGLRALAAALGARAGRVSVDVVPQFGETGLCVELQGMIRVRSGQIMSAIVTSSASQINRRIARWTDTRLKA